MSKEEPLLNLKNWIIGGSAFIVGIFILNLLVNGAISDFRNNKEIDKEPTFYDTGNIDDMTEKELKEYLKWQQKQNQKRNNNSKVFD